MVESVLAGWRVAVTRERLEPLGDLLRRRGAEPVHLPSITVTDPLDGGAALARELDRLDRFDWLVVTSPNGAARVGASAAGRDIGLAAVGTATAERLASFAGRPVDVVPSVQRAEALAEELRGALPSGTAAILVAQADRAGPLLADELRAAGHEVTVVTAYRTLVTPPDLAPLLDDPADALLLASGSAARAWVEATDRLAARTPVAGGLDSDDPVTPPIVVAIGPSTAAAARDLGLEVSAVATEQSLAGLVAALESTVGERRGA